MSDMVRFAFTFFVSVTLFIPGMPVSGQFDLNDMADNLTEAKSFLKYPTYEQYVEIMQDFASGYPAICRLENIGNSVEGRQILVLKISDNPDQEEAEARFLYSSTMHGDELVGFPLMLRLIDYLLSRYGTDSQVTELVDGLEIWINPLANPDGTYENGNHTMVGADRENTDNKDLNRNFPNLSLGEPDSETGRPVENQHMMRFLREHRFNLSANIHSGQELVNYPWDWTYDLHADDVWYRFICREYADEAHSADPTYMRVFDDGIVNGAVWYVAQGTRQDYVNNFLGGREVTLELSLDFLLDSDSLDSYWNKNYRSFLYYMTQATYGVHGKITSKESGAPVEAEVYIPGYDQHYSSVFSTGDHGDFYRYLKGGTYDLVVTAEGYINDTIPGLQVTDWQTTHLDIVLDSVVPSGPSFNIEDMAEDLVEALTFTKYPTYDQYVEMMNQFAAQYPDICVLDTIGISNEDRLVLALKISDNAGVEEAEADFFYTSTADGADLVGYVLTLRLAHHLLTRYDSDPEVTGLINNLAIWINPVANPDGLFAGGNHTVEGATHWNALGVNQNRDFPESVNGDPDNSEGRDKETQDMMQFLKEHRFSMSAGIFAGFETFNYPWDNRQESHVDEEWFRKLGSEFVAEAQMADPQFMTQFVGGMIQGFDWGATPGTRQDYTNYYLGGRDVTLGLAMDEQLDSDHLQEYWEKTGASLIKLMTQCTYGIRGRVTSSVCGCPIQATVSIPSIDQAYSMVQSSPSGDYYRLVYEGSYDVVFSAPGYLNDTIHVKVDPSSFTRLDVSLDSIVPQDTATFNMNDMASSLDEALTFRKYPTYDQYVEMMFGFAAQYPSICSLVVFGSSNQGRQLLALKISDQVNQMEQEPRFLLTSTINGDDLAGYVLSLRMADYLLSNYGTDAKVSRLLDHIEIWINPLANPDGTYYNDNNNSVVHAQARNASGVDLDSDFPDPSTGEPDDTTGRAVETRYMMQFLRDQMFTVSVNIQGGSEVINYPWDHTTNLHDDDQWFTLVSGEYTQWAKGVDVDYFNSFDGGITNGASWFERQGGRQDYVNHYLEGREVTLFLSKVPKLDSDRLQEYWNKNRLSLLNYMTHSMFGLHGTVTSSGRGAPLIAEIAIEGFNDPASVIHSRSVFGDYYRPIKGGIFNVTYAADGYEPKTHMVSVADYQTTILDVSLDTLIGSGWNNPEMLPFRLWPNPAADYLHLDLNGEKSRPVKVAIYSSEGHLVHSVWLDYRGEAMRLDVNRLGQGIWFLQVTTGSATRTLKFLKE